MAYEAGTAFLQIVASFQGVVEAISAEAAKWGQSAGTTFSDSFKARVDAALKSLPDAKIGADISEAEAKLGTIRAELESLSGERIGVSISDDEAKARLTVLKADLDELGAKDPTIRVHVEAAQAELELAAVAVEADIAGKNLGQAEVGAGGAAGGMESLAADAGAASGSVGMLIPLVAALASALVPIAGLAAGALAALPAIFAGAATGAGALYLGLSGIPAALSAYSATQKAPIGGVGGSSAGTALSNASAERNAANSVQSAEEALANARINGARNVANAEQAAAAARVNANQSIINAENALVQAERNVTQAQYSEVQAQEAVVAARQNAQRQLDDYTNQLADAGLASRQAALDVQTAKASLDAANAPNSGASALQIAQAQLTYDQALQRVTDLQTQNQQLTQDATAAAAAGVDGNAQVLSAQHQLALAQQATIDAQTAQTNAAANIATVTLAANQSIIQSEQAVTQAKRQTAQSISDTERALTQALANQADAFARAAIPTGAGATAAQAYERALASLTPAGRTFVEFMTGTLYPAFDGLKAKTQAAFLPLLESGLTDLLPFFRDLQPFIIQAAQGIGKTFDELAKFISSKSGLAEVTQIFKDGNMFMSDMGGAMVKLFEALTGIGAQATPIVKAMATGINDMMNAFAKWVSGGGFEQFLVWLQANGPAVVQSIVDLVVAVGKFIVAIEPIGGVLLKAIDLFAKLVSWVVESWQRFSEYLIVIGSVAAAITLLVGGPVSALIAAVAAVVAGIIILVVHWRDVWSTIKTITEESIKAVVGFFKSLPDEAYKALKDFGSVVWNAIVVSADWLATHVGQPILNFFTGLPDKIASAAKGMWHGISDAFKEAINTVIGWWDSLKFHVGGINLGLFHTPSFTLEVPQIPKFHDGGVVQGAPGVEQLAWLMPGEVVTPAAASVPSGHGGSPLSLNLVINGADLSSIPAFREEITRAFTLFADELQPMKVA